MIASLLANDASWLSPALRRVVQCFAVLVAIASGVMVGFINGLLVAKIGIPSFIATLGTQFFWYGMATVLSGGKSYALRSAEESSVWHLLVGRPFAGTPASIWVQQLPIQSLWTAIIVVALWFILNRHRFGEHTLFIGDSNEVSRVVGIDVDREKIKLFTLMGALAAVAAIFLTLENKNYFGNQGQGYLLIAIASVLIGGTSIFGGRATIVGTIFGCFIIAMVEPGLVATGLTGAWVNTVRGLIFLIAIIFYLYVDEPQRRARLLRAPAAAAGIWPDTFGRMSDRGRHQMGAGAWTKGGNDHENDQNSSGRQPPCSALLTGAGAAVCRRTRSARASPCTCRWAATPATAPRSPARPAPPQAAAALGVDLKEQFSAWAPETMINQFKEAVAAKPTCIEIMGHPGGTAFHDLVKAPSTRVSSSPSAIRR